LAGCVDDWRAVAGRGLMASNPFDPALFRPDAIAPETRAFNEQLAKQPSRMSWRGLPAEERHKIRLGPVVNSPRARTISIQSQGLTLKLRVLPPTKDPKGVYLHFHGGGLVMGSAEHHDPMLERIADRSGLTCASAEYRLAPENPYPAAWDDCEAAAVWLAKNAKAEFGADLVAIGGESAGATLSVPTLVRMRDRHGFTGFKAANLSYGNYDTSGSPSQTWIGATSLLIRTADIEECSDAYAPDPSQRRNPDLSAHYAKLNDMPAALFTVGTGDPFLDDSLFMYARWIAAGNEAELAVYPGGIHAFNVFPIPIAEEANARIDAFLKARAGG
jgi:acetyl esterase/lipase